MSIGTAVCEGGRSPGGVEDCVKYLSVGSREKDPAKDGIIFDIQRYSVHDGPGIRTLVFLSGCPLRCVWCANPESQKTVPQVMWDSKTCRRCQKCNEICPEGAITEGANAKMIDRAKCTGCGLCDKVCASHSIMLAGRYVNVDEVMAEVDKDKVFYKTSGGGVTIGGGEPLLQPGFARKLLAASRERGYNTAIETAGYVPWENMEKVIPYTDLFLYDIKLLDAEKHGRYIGTDNALILENVRKLKQAGANILVRMPVIPGINDSDESIEAVAALAGSMHMDGMQLLPYHMMGTGKYTQLGETYRLTDAKRFDDETAAAMKQRAKEIYLKNYMKSEGAKQ